MRANFDYRFLVDLFESYAILQFNIVTYLVKLRNNSFESPMALHLCLNYDVYCA